MGYYRNRRKRITRRRWAIVGSTFRFKLSDLIHWRCLENMTSGEMRRGIMEPLAVAKHIEMCARCQGKNQRPYSVTGRSSASTRWR